MQLGPDPADKDTPCDTRYPDRNSACILAAPLAIQLLANAPDTPCVWAPPIHGGGGDTDGIPGSWLGVEPHSDSIPVCGNEQTLKKECQVVKDSEG